MLKFLKALLGREEDVQQQVESVKLEVSREWFSQAVKGEKDAISQSLKQQAAVIEGILADTRSSLQVLREAGLKNPEIAQRAKDIMEGNRNTYVKRTLAFLDEVRPASEPGQIEELLENFKSRLQALNSASAKSYYVLQEFFAHESKDVAMQIKKLEQAIADMKKVVDNSRYNEIREAERLFEEHSRKSDAKAHLQAEASQLLTEIDSLKKQKDETAKAIEEIKQSDAYSKYFELIQRKEQYTKELAAIEQEFSSIASALEPALHRYARIHPEDRLAADYLEAPFETFRQDSALGIISIGRNMSELIKNNAIELKDKRKERALEALGRLSEVYLNDLLNRHREAGKQLQGLSHEILKNAAMQDYNELDYRLNHVNSKLVNAESRLDELRKSTDKIDLDILKTSLEAQLSKCLAKRIVLV